MNVRPVSKAMILLVLIVLILIATIGSIILVYQRTGNANGGENIPAGDPGYDGTGNMTLPDGMSLLDAAGISMQNASVSRWASAHPAYGLSHAYSDHVMPDGLSSYWYLIYSSNNAFMVVKVQYGNVSSAIAYDSGHIIAPAMSLDSLLDSTGAMEEFHSLNNTGSVSSIASLHLYPEGANGTYVITYYDLRTNDVICTTTLDAVSGAVISNSTPDEEASDEGSP